MFSLMLAINIWGLCFKQGPSGCSVGIRLKETEAEAGNPVTSDYNSPSWRAWYLDQTGGSRGGADRAKTADGNQLREAPRFGVRPGPSPAPADPAKGGGRGRPSSPPFSCSRAPCPGMSGAPDAFQMTLARPLP
ncbi:guanine nucleotide-binding protein G(I)/G(S)/G(O) subunit gamma-8 isoform X1 [Phacochoerus africanus]|uniref:guanine nucleotide-binding protein G(I)/G(S)/G(O) subunit gamma-8 isoform X1 n=1 Tax=Phacochoerus africanus TaxID=41426 RepID=UPI001FDAC330|nr:guanine nucleotide-binding protein G(I)/G(S)/G(O) subunit gamma-8 isoform X1 [Phacochoerus africanus]